ncbi:MAG: DUF6034 family protein, partial [Christensenellaceae bacterium]
VQYKNSTVAQDAEVAVPDATAYTVTEVSKRVFSTDDIKRMIQELTGATTFYSDWKLNKNDCLARLTFAKQNLGKDGIDQKLIDYLETQFKNAPEQVNNPILDLGKAPFDKFIYAYTDSGNGNASISSFIKDQNSFDYSRSISQNFVPKSMMEPQTWEIPGEPDISESDALAIAQSWLNKFGADLKLLRSEPCSVTETSAKIGTGWSFTFTREIAGLQKDYQFFPSFISHSSLPSTGAPWEEEVFRIVVDKDGVGMLSWSGASKIGKTLSENEPLLDLSEIQTRALNQMNFNLGDNLLEGLKVDYTITKYELGISMISVKDQPGLGWYIPTWYVTYKFTSEEGLVFEEQIMFNAMDGSYIEPRVTTTELMAIGNR